MRLRVGLLEEGLLGFRALSRRLGWKGIAVFASALGMAGCATSTRTVQVRPSAASPIPPLTVDINSLPIAPAHVYPPLIPATQPGVDVLIEQVEQDLKQGESEYQANHLPEARKSFDTAINRLMQSGLNLSADPRLEPLMDRLVTTMHNDQLNIGEVAASDTDAESGDEESPGPASPLDEIATAANLPENPELAQKAAAELLHIPHDLPLTVNQPVLNFLSFFETPRGRGIIQRSLERAGRYSAMVRRVLKQEGLPQDLMYLPLPESGYQPRAVSRAGARGLWQFMPGTGRLYGLKINRWEDQRMDPEESTRAAAQHLRELYGIFHDWYLALAAYDAGSASVARAIERTGYADFWQLYRLKAFPAAETRNYVPIMLAMTLVAKDPGLYGVNVANPEKSVETEPFRPGHSIDLRLVADAVGVSVKSMEALNPALFGVITPNDASYVLHLPAGTKDRLETLLDSIPQSHWVNWRLHRVADGETLQAIASKYHMQLASFAKANDIPLDDPVESGRMVLVPAPVVPSVLYYRVRRGDTVGGIAMRYRVSIREVRAWNHLRSNLIRIGQRLRIYVRQSRAGYVQASSRERSTSTSTSSSSGGYVARSGDSFWSISRRFGTTVAALRSANPEVTRRGLKVGDHLVVPNSGSRSAAASSGSGGASSGSGGGYVARSGDSFWSISRRFDTSVGALRDANPEITRRGLKVGDRVVIPK